MRLWGEPGALKVRCLYLSANCCLPRCLTRCAVELVVSGERVETGCTRVSPGEMGTSRHLRGLFLPLMWDPASLPARKIIWDREHCLAGPESTRVLQGPRICPLSVGGWQRAEREPRDQPDNGVIDARPVHAGELCLCVVDRSWQVVWGRRRRTCTREEATRKCLMWQSRPR